MKLFLTILCSLAVNSVWAGDGHNHEAAVESAPHGGVLRDAPPYKVELVLNGDQAKIYVYDKGLKPVKLDKDTAKGELRFPKEKKAKEVVFKKNGEVYETTLAGISKVHRYDLHVNLEAGASKVLVDFGVDNIH
ncbi:MAG: hypothetical protein SGJ18_06615 [Pseudomonadota bacterium]|nr:hypothetical protein [Pseudomonadota bacterium]